MNAASPSPAPPSQATLIVNPRAGRAALLSDQLEAIRSLLASKDLRMRVVYTPVDAAATRELATDAARESSLVLACGGDGTVHSVIQGLAHSAATLGVLPLGTANALARNLSLPLDPLSALARLLTYTPRTIPLGEVLTPTRSCFFIVMAGCGPDGALVHLLAEPSASSIKSRFGRQAYYAHAARLFLTRHWPPFRVEMRLPGAQAWLEREAVALMAARVPDLGGLFSGLTPLACLSSPHLRLHLLHPPAQVSFPAWFGLSRTKLPNPWLTTLDVDEVRCTPTTAVETWPPGSVYAQADAEPLGTLPMSLRVAPAALNLLMPPGI